VEILKTKGDIGRVHATAKVDGELATEGDFVFALSRIRD
jgi:3-hydroxymyristoyl/3-hydroxydecanoyl-(acyl carrier protein) dehydratase